MEEDQQHDMHAAMDHPIHTVSYTSAHNTPQEHVMPASGEITAPFILLVPGRMEIERDHYFLGEVLRPVFVYGFYY